MLHDFVSSNHDELVSRTREKLATRPPPAASTDEPEDGIPLFLAQLSETLRLEATATPFSPSAMGASAAEHGRQLLAKGYGISQVVHGYGDVCQAITELAAEKRATISLEEFHTLNRCLDVAIAEAVTEYARLKEEASSRHDLERRGRIAHDLRNVVQTAQLSFQVLKAGNGGVSGSAGALLGRSLVDIRVLVDGIASEVRRDATEEPPPRVAAGAR